jgi:hypothetical protein
MLPTIQFRTFCLLVCCLKNANIKRRKTIIFACCFVWLRNLVFDIREEHRLRVIENWMLKKIFESKRDGIVRAWRKLHSEALHNLYSLSSVIRMIRSKRMS